jgi:hypothetical protein
VRCELIKIALVAFENNLVILLSRLGWFFHLENRFILLWQLICLVLLKTSVDYLISVITAEQHYSEEC